MRKELPYFKIGSSYGGNQDWYADAWMRRGGCAAETACELSIYLAKYYGLSALCPFDPEQINQKVYVDFGQQMKPYLRPRFGGIDKLSIYQEGYGQYLADHGVKLQLEGWEGTNTVARTAEVVRQQIDKGMPIPCLVLKHRAPSMNFYVWHWFMLTGYEYFEDICMVKAVTYGSWNWLDLRTLWQSGYRRKGGLILAGLDKAKSEE